MKKLSLLLILSLSTTHASTAFNPDVAYKTSNWITEHWFRKSCTNYQLPSELVYTISQFTTFPYCSPQPVIQFVLPNKQPNRLINITKYQNNTYITLSSICNHKTLHIQVASLNNLQLINEFIPQRCTCNIISSTIRPSFIQKNTSHRDKTILAMLPSSVKHKNFSIKQYGRFLNDTYYDPITSQLIISQHNREKLYIIHQYNKIRQTLSYDSQTNMPFGIWCNKILFSPNDKSILMKLWDFNGNKNAILQFKYDPKHNTYHPQPIFLHKFSFHTFKDEHSFLHNLDYTVVFLPKQNTLYCYCVETDNGQLNMVTNTIEPNTSLEHYKEYIGVIDLKNTQNIKKIPIQNNANHTFCRFVSGGTNVIGYIFLSNNHQSKSLAYFATLNTADIQKNTVCINTNNMIQVDLFQNKGTLSRLYNSLTLENNTQLSCDNQRIIHVYKDKNTHRMVQFDTTTGKEINAWQLTTQKKAMLNNHNNDDIGSTILISTSLGFVTLATNFFVRSHY